MHPGAAAFRTVVQPLKRIAKDTEGGQTQQPTLLLLAMMGYVDGLCCAGHEAPVVSSKSVRIGVADFKAIFYCEHCKSSFFDDASLTHCGDPACTKGVCSNCVSNGLCEDCTRDVRRVISDAVDGALDENGYYSDRGAVTIDDSDDSDCPRSWSGDDIVPHWEAAGYASEDVCEHALANTEENAKLPTHSSGLEDRIMEACPVRLKLSLKWYGVVKCRLSQRIKRTGKRMSKPGWSLKYPHYGASEPVTVRVKLAYCCPKYFDAGPVKLGLGLFRARTYVSPPGSRTYTPVTAR